MQIEVQRSAGTATVLLRGRFDFRSHGEFRSACDEALEDPCANALEIDFGGIESVDSAALGALLLVRHRARQAKRSLRLANCDGPVGEVLSIACFGRLFPTVVGSGSSPFGEGR